MARPSSHHARVLQLFVLTVNLLASGIAQADSSPKTPAADQLVFLGLRPVKVAQEPSGGPEVPVAGDARRSPTLAATRADKPPNIDGRLDEPAWQKASLETNFAQHFPDEGKAPTERTELRVLYDDSAMYVAIRCFDLHPDEIVARLTRRDRDIDGDKVTVDISSKNDKATAYHFQVNAAGVQVDGLRFNDTDYNNDWDGRWYSATTRDAQGWTTELKIPLVTLRYGGSVSSFGFQVRRYLGRREEIDEWAYIPRTAKGEVSYYGTLEGLVGLNSERLFQVLAYASSRLTLRGGQGAFDGSTKDASIGADLKLGITTALTLDGTINPDFGTVEADQVVLNLTTLETNFPEKRPFFIEGADLFTTPLNLFYSRRVGATPPAPSLGPGAQLVAPVPDGRIYSALKLTGSVANRLSIGVVDAVTAQEDAVVDRGTGGPAEKLLVEPLTNFGVLRLRQDFGTNSSIGLLATSVNRFEPANAAAPQPMDLCPVPYSTTFATLVAPPPRNGRCTNDAYTAGLDTVLRTDNGEWGASAQLVGSRIENGPTRLIPDGTRIGSGSSGVGLVAEAGRYGGETWLYRIAYGFSTPQLQINDAGFQDQANLHDFVGSVTMRTTTPSRYLLGASLEFFVEHKREWSFQDNVDFNGQIKPTLELSNFWTVSAGIMPYFPKYVDHRETQDGARTERNAGLFGVFEVKSDPKKLFVLDLSAASLKVYGGETTWEVASTLSLRPIPALELDLIPHMTVTSGAARWVDTEMNMDGSRTYYFSDLDAKELDLTLRGTYTFRRNLSLQAYLQPFVDSGHYSNAVASTASGQKPLLPLDSFTPTTLPAGVMPDFRDGTINVNLFLRWEYLPLSALWLVFIHSQEQTPYSASEGPGRIRFDRFAHGPATDVFLLKLSYLW